MALVAEITGLFVEQETNGAVRDKSPVLHGTGFKVRNGDKIHLGQRVGHTKQLGEVLEGKGGHRQGKLGLLGLSWEDVDAAGNGRGQVLGHGLDILKFAHNKSDQLSLALNYLHKHMG